MLVLQFFSAYALLGASIGECFCNGALPTAALLWLALAPLPIGIVALLRRGRPLGLMLLGVGFPLHVLTVGKDSCPASALALEDADGAIVAVDGWTLVIYLVVLVSFGLVMVLGRRT